MVEIKKEGQTRPTSSVIKEKAKQLSLALCYVLLITYRISGRFIV
jgi:hypothetical protein